VVFFSQSVIHIFSEPPYSYFKSQEVRGCAIRVFALTIERPHILVVIACVQFVTCETSLFERLYHRSIGTTAMFRMLHNYSGRRYAHSQALAIVFLHYHHCREAGIPINILRPTVDSSMGTAVSSQPINGLKVSVHTTTDSFGEETTRKEEA
jgi:hypothetical protein